MLVVRVSPYTAHSVAAGFIRLRERERESKIGHQRETRVILKPNLLSDISSLLPNSTCYMLDTFECEDYTRM